MTISLLHPAFLLLLLALPALWFLPRRIESREQRIQAILRSLLLACLILVLARPVLLAAGRDLFQVLIVDESDSLGDLQRQQARLLTQHWLERIAGKDQKKSSVILIDGTPSSVTQSQKRFERAGAVIHLQAARSTSSLSAALAAALRQIPLGSPGTITVLSDGLSTDRRWGPVVQSLIRRGITVNVATLSRDERDVYPAGITTDRLLRVGQTINVNVQLIGKTSGARVRLLDGAGEQLAVSQPLDSDGRITVPLQFEPDSAGFMNVRAEVSTPAGQDSNAANNTLDKTLAIQQPIRLLYLGERQQHGAARLAQLLGSGFQIDDGSNWDLTTEPDLQRYELVMIDDRNAARLSQVFQARLAAAVRDRGLGLLFCGGKAAFGAGGYDQSAVAATLPVNFAQHTEKRDPSTALAVVIDTSGSMAGERIELAKQVARLAIRRLKAHDRVGIVEFYGNKQWALPMQSAASKISIDRAMARMQASGGTVLFPAIEEAYYGLKNVVARYKHVLIITDAGVEDADYEALIRKIAKAHINVSTVLVGAQAHSQSLIDMATWGQGRFYSAADRYSLPEIILKQPSTQKLPEYRSGAFAVQARGAAGWWGDIDAADLPLLSGYVETQPRPGSQVLIEVSGSSHPVLATWNYGLGRVTVLTTEPVGEGTAGWRQWRDYGRMLARIASYTAADNTAFGYTIERNDRRVTVSARRYSPSSSLYPQANVLDAKGEASAALNFRQLAPDYFAADLDVDPASQMRVSATAKDPTDGTQLQTATLLASMAGADLADEHQVDPQSALNLQALAAATSGAILDPTQPDRAQLEAQPREDQASIDLYKLWWFALLLALLLYLAELTWRRWPRA